MKIEYMVGDSTLGRFLVGLSKAGLCLLELGDDDQALVEGIRRRFPRARLLAGETPDYREAVTALLDRQQPLSLPLDLHGTEFQLRVWQALRAIPAGETRSYGQLAGELGQPGAVRAVAGACGANKLAVAIPCHRVVRSDGGLGGYRWGVARKQLLLVREGKLVSGAAAP